MSAKHMPGPWAVGPWVRAGGKHVYANIGNGPDRIAAVTVYGRMRDSDRVAGRPLRDGSHTRSVPVEVAEANARLIAAAPELLAALQDMVHYDDLPEAEQALAMAKARAAVAKLAELGLVQVKK